MSNAAACMNLSYADAARVILRNSWRALSAERLCLHSASSPAAKSTVLKSYHISGRVTWWN